MTYATNATTNAPSNLTTAQLNSIYSCSVTNWNQVGGKNAPIKAELPQTSSGTRAFFLTAIGLGTSGPGGCVDSTAEENEGVNEVLAGPNVIFPFSIGKYLAEKFHSAKCVNKACTGSPACHPVERVLQEGSSGRSPALRTDRVLPAVSRCQVAERLEQCRDLHHR